MEDSHRDESYLTTFLACGLYKFLFRNKKVDCIRASIFKVARFMTHVQKNSLTIMFLAIIYRAHRDISLLKT